MNKNPEKRPSIQIIERFFGKENSKSKNKKNIKEKIVDRYYKVTQKNDMCIKYNTF